MSFAEIIYAVTGAAGWIIIALAVVALGFVIAGYLRQAREIVSSDGYGELWRQIRKHVLTRKPRHRR